MQKGQSCSSCMHWYDSLNQCRRHAPEGAKRPGTGHVDPLWPHTNPEQWCGDWTETPKPEEPSAVPDFGFPYPPFPSFIPPLPPFRIAELPNAKTIDMWSPLVWFAWFILCAGIGAAAAFTWLHFH